MTIGEASSRVLHAGSDLIELLRLAQGAVQRLEEEVHGEALDEVDKIARDLRRMRRTAESLKPSLERFVVESQSASVADSAAGEPPAERRRRRDRRRGADTAPP